MFTYIHKGEYHSDTSDNYFQSLGLEEEVIEHIRDLEKLHKQQVCQTVREERDAKMGSVLGKVERYQLQRELGISTDDTPEWYASALSYLQLLREVPQQEGFPENVEWPVEP